MKKILKSFMYLLILIALVIFFLPKTNLYYAAEILMKENHLFISDELVLDKGYALELKNSKLLFDNLDLAEVESIELSPWIFYNTLRLENIRINEGFSDFLPAEIRSVSVQHLVYNPLKLILRGDSDDSFFFGDVDLLERVLVIHLRLGTQSEKKYSNLLGRLNKEEGGYI